MLEQTDAVTSYREEKTGAKSNVKKAAAGTSR